jgi:hypothetical protein
LFFGNLSWRVVEVVVAVTEHRQAVLVQPHHSVLVAAAVVAV